MLQCCWEKTENVSQRDSSERVANVLLITPEKSPDRDRCTEGALLMLKGREKLPVLPEKSDAAPVATNSALLEPPFRRGLATATETHARVRGWALFGTFLGCYPETCCFSHRVGPRRLLICDIGRMAQMHAHNRGPTHMSTTTIVQ